MTDIISTIITGLIGLVAGNLMSLITFPQTKSMKKIENEAKQSEEWKKLYIDQKNEALEKDKKIDQLYAEITKYRDENAELHLENEKLKIENSKLVIVKCLKPGCVDRDPPSIF